MCFTYDYMPQVQRSEIATARKVHQCCSCCRSIQPGELYWRVTSIDSREGLDTSKVCGECSRDESVVAEWEEAAGCGYYEQHPPLDEIRSAAEEREIVRSTAAEGQEFLKAKRDGSRC